MHAITNFSHDLDVQLLSSGVKFLPWVGARYGSFCGRCSFLILGESHYSKWDGEDHQLPKLFTRTCIEEDVCGRCSDGDHRFWKNLERALLGKERADSGWCADGGRPLWDQLAFYNFLTQALSVPGHRPTKLQFRDSQAPFESVLQALRPQRVLVCGKDLWNRGMGRTVAHLHDDIQAYTLREGSHAWCLSVRHPSRWLPSHELISAFIDNPERAANLLRNGPRD